MSSIIYSVTTLKRYDTAIQICERLLKSADARKIKELWLTIIYIHRCKSQSNQQVTAESTKSNSSDSSLVEETVKTCLNMFPEDAQVTYVAAQFFSSIVRILPSLTTSEKTNRFNPYKFFFILLIEETFHFN